MNEITTLFTAIGDFFTKSAWYPMVKWPFWTLLFVVAAGGVYCARFGKKNLLNQGISSTLCIVSIYMGAITLSASFAPFRGLFNLPFLAITKESAILLNPLVMNPNEIPAVLLKLMMLVFLINIADSFGAGGKSIFSWIITEAVSMVIALGLYFFLNTGIMAIAPWVFGKHSIIPVVVIIALGLMIFCSKFVFTKIITKGNEHYTKMNKFFTENRMGILLTTSALSFLFGAVLLFVVHISKQNVVVFGSANLIGLWIILAMVLLVQFIFEMFYQDRKKT